MNLAGALPNLNDILASANQPVLVVGAVTMDLYASQKWIPELRRKTGDLDLGVALHTGSADYTQLRETMTREGYQTRSFPYRFFPPQRGKTNLAYIDLLAFPFGKNITDAQARKLMGVGADFSFSGMAFAYRHAFPFAEKLVCPNPFGFMALKRASYLDDPQNRRRDLADLIELVSGLVECGQHFEMSKLWSQMQNEAEGKHVKAMLEDLNHENSLEWDIDDVRQELLMRQFTSSDIDDLIPRRITNFLDFLT